ncbi:MAG: pyruvate formate lyase activating enzyme, partial [bacterium]
MRAFDALSFWNEPDFRGAMGWYRAVANGRLPAKFRLCASLPAGVALAAPEAELWGALEAGTETFLALRRRVRDGQALAEGRPRPSLLDLVAELGRRMLAHCNFCRWDCGVDRRRGEKLGACKLGAETRVSSYFHHGGEELVYRGTHG